MTDTDERRKVTCEATGAKEIDIGIDRLYDALVELSDVIPYVMDAVSRHSRARCDMSDDPISRRAAIDAAVSYIEDWNGCKSKYHRREIEKKFQALPSAQPDFTNLAQKLWPKTCLITDNNGLQHQVIHTADLKMIIEEVAGWTI